MTAPTTDRPTLHLVSPPGPPTDAWIQAVARMLLAAADKQLAEQAAALDEDQHGGNER
jgi:hypothetical protein